MRKERTTNFTKVYADSVASLSLSGKLMGASAVETTKDHALTEDEKNSLYVEIDVTDSGKVITLGLEVGQIMFVYNSGGTNAFTLKNIATDTGTSLAKDKLVLVVGSATTDKTRVIALN